LLKRIDHIGVMVKDIDEAVKVFSEIFGFRKVDASPHTDSEGDFKSVQMTAGEVTIELIEPLDPNGPLANFLQKRGEGLHHISFEVDDIDRELELLRTKGVRLINEKAQAVGDSKVAFVHPVATKGILVELTQRVAR
jgi:methylmalonyl-CoA/ethylmalonyl-CoA epimerase